MRFFLTLVVVAFCVVLTNSCGKRPRNDAVGKPIPPFSVLGDFSFTFQKDFASSVKQLMPLEDGSLLVSGITRKTVDDSDSGFVQRIGKDGQLLFELKSKPRGEFASVVPHKGGGFTALEFVERQDFESLYELDFVEIDLTGKQSFRTPLRTIASNLFTADQDCFIDAVPTFARSAAIVAVPSADGGMFLTIYACYQHVALRLNGSHEVVWSKKLTPPLLSRTLYQSSMMTLEQSSATSMTIVLDLDDEDSNAVAKHLGLPEAPMAHEKKAFVVTINALTGDITAARVFEQSFNQKILGIAASNQTLFLFGFAARENPSNRSKLQNDMLLEAVNIDDLSTRWSRTYNFGNEQLPKALAYIKNGKLIVGGSFGHVIVDTGSWIEFPDGFLAVFDAANGDVLGGTTVHSGRSDIVLTVASLNEDTFVFGGTTDGPITHTADGNPKLGYAMGFVKTIGLDELLKGTIKLGGK